MSPEGFDPLADHDGRRSYPQWYRGQWEPDLPSGYYSGPHGTYLPSWFTRGVEPFCVCGWHPANHPGFTVVDHLKAFGVREYEDHGRIVREEIQP